MPGPGGKQERGWGGLVGGFRGAVPSPTLQFPRSSDLVSSVRGAALDSERVTRGEGAQTLPCAQQDRPGPGHPPHNPAFPFPAAGGRRGGAHCCVARAAGFSLPPSLHHSAGVWGGKTRRRSRKEGRSAHRGDTITRGLTRAHPSPHQPGGPGRLAPAAGHQLLPVEGLGDTESLHKPEQDAPKGVRPRIGEGQGSPWPPRAPRERRGVRGQEGPRGLCSRSWSRAASPLTWASLGWVTPSAHSFPGVGVGP